MAMKNKYQVVPPSVSTKKPAKAEVSDAEFRRQLKNIAEWRKKRLAEFSHLSSHTYTPISIA
jgi:hypothetical protein